MAASDKPSSEPAASHGEASFLAGGGELGALMRELDWSRTPLGPVESWPQSLRTTVSTCLNSRFPILVWWGPELVMLYNDAYRRILGNKHPASLGQAGQRSWGEIWHVIGPMLDGVLARGEATWSENQQLTIERQGFREESYFTFSYSPIRDESGSVAGVFTVVAETTAEILDARRLGTLQELALRVTGTTHVDEVCMRVRETLAKNAPDLPFSLLYRIEPASSQHGVQTRLQEHDGLASTRVLDGALAPLEGPGAAPWPLAEVVSTRAPVRVDDLEPHLGPFTMSEGRARPRSALILPVLAQGDASPIAVLVVGLSPQLSLDGRYRAFLELLAGAIATAMASAQAHEDERGRSAALAELDRQKTAFFSNVSHEFRTPLTLMLGPIEDGLADTQDPLSPGQRDRQQLVRRNGLRLQKLVNTLLDFARIEAGRAQVSFVPTNLSALTRELVSSFDSAMTSAGLRMSVDCPELPEPVYVDPAMWEKVVLNLLSNALKFTFKGEVRVALRWQEDHVDLTVEDTGTGIPRQELPLIFERFHRVEGARGRSHEGTGIGLALVHDLTKLHGGDVRVNSTLGRGTTFTVSLPTGSSHVEAARRSTRTLTSTGIGPGSFLAEVTQWNGAETLDPEQRATRPPSVPPVGTGPRLLVVDDNADMRGYLARLFSPHYTVQLAVDGAEALAVARLHPPALILSDVMMPGLSGLQLVQALRSEEATRGIPIMLLSARAGEDATIEGLEAGADDYLLKPFSSLTLLARVRAVLKRASESRESAAPLPPTHDFLAGGGEMGKLIRAMDWSKTPLGPVDTWPQSLRTTVSLCLASSFPMSMAWGPKHVQIYNDGYWPICGAKHPHAMGQDFSECWASAWPAIGDAFERALEGETRYLENVRMFLDRNGYLEESFFTFSFSPIRDETGGVGGLFHPVTETTGNMLAERRTGVVRDLAAKTSKAKTTASAFALTTQVLETADLDLPFVLFYMFAADGEHAELAGVSGLVPDSALVPARLDLSADDTWPVAEVLRTGQRQMVEGLASRFGVEVCGPYPELPDAALVLPLFPPGAEHAMGVLVAGLSSRLPRSEAYLSFCDLVASTLTTSIANARAYEEESKRAEALAEIDRAKTAFFSNVSHEFRTPLTLILGPVEDAIARPEQALTGRQLDMVRRNALRLYKMVNTLLDFSRMEAGRAQATFVPTDLAAFTRSLASSFQSAVESAGIVLRVDCPALPEPIYVDPEMWEKVVLNLLSNAVKYTYQGEIRVTMRWEDRAAVLTVEDTGVGIPDEELPRVFERFYRVKATEGRSHEGTGIGLALVQELVKLHGGTVSVKSELGSGTTFTARVPGGPAHLPSDRVERTARARSSGNGAAPYVQEVQNWSETDVGSGSELRPNHVSIAPEIADARILLVDDNPDLRGYVRDLLLQSFPNVQTASDGLAALELARKQLPDLILSDVMMPRMDGFTMVQELREDPRTRGVAIILLSARAGEESTVEALHAGADDYLVKPFSARELIARVHAQLQMVRMRGQLVAKSTREADLQDALRSRDDFLSIASHELRTPVTVLALQMETLSTDKIITLPPERLQSQSLKMQKHVRRLTRLVGDLADVAELVTGQLQPMFEARDVVEVAASVVAQLQDQAARVNVTLTLRPAPRTVCPCDALRLQQLLTKLVDNALRFGPDGPVELVIDSTATEVQIQVIDRGPGIPEADRERVVQRFERAVSVRNHGGFGLGLWMVAQIVEAHRGKLEIGDTPRGGATVTVRLPRLLELSATPPGALHKAPLTH